MLFYQFLYRDTYFYSHFIYSFEMWCAICVNIYFPAIWRRSKVIYLKTENNGKWKWPNRTGCASAKIFLLSSMEFCEFSPLESIWSHLALYIVYIVCSLIWFRQMLTQQKIYPAPCEKLWIEYMCSKQKKREYKKYYTTKINK